TAHHDAPPRARACGRGARTGDDVLRRRDRHRDAHRAALTRAAVRDFLSLAGRTALVTGAGAANGSGRGIAQVLAERGAAVAVNDIEPALAAESAEAIEATGGRAFPVVFDVTDFEAVGRGVQEIEAKAGPV